MAEQVTDIRSQPADYFRWLRVIAKDIVDAVATLHAKGLVHGDLKPSNILVYRREGQGHAKVSDYCVDAIVADAQGPRSLLQDRTTGASYAFPFSFRFAAPEVLSGLGRPLTPRIDVYSLGVLFGDLFLLRLADTITGNALREDVLRESEAYRRISKSGLSDVLKIATAHEASKRFRGVPELWEALQKSIPNI